MSSTDLPDTDNLSYRAMKFAMQKHSIQKRKYTDEPYWTHLAQVVGLVSSVHSSELIHAIAWLHDVLEDTDTSDKEILQEFGEVVWNGVRALSDLEEGNRETRKRLSRERLSKAINYIQDIKVCDLISNTPSIVKHDPKFAPIYLEEKRLLLDCLNNAAKELLEMAKGVDTLN